MPTLPSAARSLARALPVEATALWLPLWLTDPLVGPWATGGATRASRRPGKGDGRRDGAGPRGLLHGRPRVQAEGVGRGETAARSAGPEGSRHAAWNGGGPRGQRRRQPPDGEGRGIRRGSGHHGITCCCACRCCRRCRGTGPSLSITIPGHVIIARRCKGQLSPILSDCLEATSWRFHSGSSHFCTAVQGAAIVNLFGLS